ncbi:MAG: hypothetical protein AAF518_06985 [Spirochaetota bacterium]
MKYIISFSIMMAICTTFAIADGTTVDKTLAEMLTVQEETEQIISKIDTVFKEHRENRQVVAKPFFFHVRDLMQGKVAIANKTNFVIQGIPLTHYYSYTYKKKTYSVKKPSVADANHFYFPVLPKNYNASKDKIQIFVHANVDQFRKLTKQLTTFMNFTDEEKLIKAKKSFMPVPKIIQNVYLQKNIKLAPSDKILTVDLDEIE